MIISYLTALEDHWVIPFLTANILFLSKDSWGCKTQCLALKK